MNILRGFYALSTAGMSTTTTGQETSFWPYAEEEEVPHYVVENSSYRETHMRWAQNLTLMINNLVYYMCKCHLLKQMQLRY